MFHYVQHYLLLRSDAVPHFALIVLSLRSLTTHALVWGANGGVGEGGEASGSPTRLHSEN